MATLIVIDIEYRYKSNSQLHTLFASLSLMMYYNYSCAIYKNTIKFTGYSASRATVPKCTFSCLSLSLGFLPLVCLFRTMATIANISQFSYFPIFLVGHFSGSSSLRAYASSFIALHSFWGTGKGFSLPCCLFVSSDKDMLHAVAVGGSIMLECRCLQHRKYVAAGYTSAIVALAATPPQLPPQLPHPWPCDQLLLYNED